MNLWPGSYQGRRIAGKLATFFYGKLHDRAWAGFLWANKRIILLSDGTGNSAGKVWRTNVWRVFESLDLTSSQQIAFYDDGVGTSSFKPFAILGGAFGFGLKRNVLDIYKFACRNYRSHLDYLALEAAAAKAENREERYGPWQSDDIFGFGFSRGAFTIRVVNGLICEQGLVSYQTEEELDRKVAIAYRAHRAEKFKSRFQVEWVFRKLRNLFVSSKHDKHERPVDHIAFLGLWDTVAAYGLPVDENDTGRQPLSVAARTAGPAARSKGSQGLSRPFARRRAHYFPSPAMGREAGDGCHRHQENPFGNELPRSGSPAYIPMSAADIRMTRSPMYRSPGCCPRLAAAGSP